MVTTGPLDPMPYDEYKRTSDTLIRGAQMKLDLFGSLTPADRTAMADLILLSDDYANGERILLAELPPMTRVRYTRGSYVTACTLAALAILLPVLVGAFVHPILLFAFPLLICLAIGVGALTR